MFNPINQNEKILKIESTSTGDKLVICGSAKTANFLFNPQERFIEACKLGFKDIVKDLLKNERVKPNEGSSLARACEKGRLKTVKVLQR